MAKSKPGLRPGSLTPEEAQELGRIGGIESGRVRREKRALRELLEEALDMVVVRKGKPVTMKAAAAAELADKMAGGSLKAIEIGARLLGESEERHSVTVTNARDLTPEEQAAIYAKLDEKL